MGGSAGTEGERETRRRGEEGRTGRVRSEVATDRLGYFRSLQFSWKCCSLLGARRPQGKESREGTGQTAGDVRPML